MKSWRAATLVAVIAAVGAAATFAVGAATGMESQELVHLVVYIVPALLGTALATTVARPLLSRATLRQRFVAVAVAGVASSLANLLVLTQLMFVSRHDATLVAILLLYSIGAGVGVGLVLARGSDRGIARLADTARALGEGDLDARVGSIDAGPELESLERTLDGMAGKLQAAAARERAIETIRRDLMNAVSHDLRTPLASLQAMVEGIDDGIIDDAPSFRRYAAEMRRSVHELVRMVDDLFELTQLDAGAIEFETKRARLEDVVDAAVATVQMQAATKGLVVKANLNGVGDTLCSPRVARVLQNLLGNAVRHTPSDGSVWVEARRDGQALELAVRDTGEGIRPEDLPHVFDPFFRGDPARSVPGAGLGLALAKRIVETLGGQIEAESSPQTGARFAVRLPVRAETSGGH
jgi:signal transduction histidine kinase